MAASIRGPGIQVFCTLVGPGLFLINSCFMPPVVGHRTPAFHALPFLSPASPLGLSTPTPPLVCSGRSVGGPARRFIFGRAGSSPCGVLRDVPGPQPGGRGPAPDLEGRDCGGNVT